MKAQLVVIIAVIFASLFPFQAMADDPLAAAAITPPSFELFEWRITSDGPQLEWKSAERAWFVFHRPGADDGGAYIEARAAFGNKEGEDPTNFIGFKVRPEATVETLHGHEVAVEGGNLKDVGLSMTHVARTAGYSSVWEGVISLWGKAGGFSIDQVEPIDPRKKFFLTGRVSVTHYHRDYNIGLGFRPSPSVSALVMGGSRLYYDVRFQILKIER